MMGIMEFGLIFISSMILEGAGSIAGRTGKTGYSEGERTAFIRGEILRLSGNYLDPARININILHYGTFGDVGDPEPCINPTTPPCPGVAGTNFVDVNGNGTWDLDQGISGPGQRDRIVLYRITYDWPIITPLMRNIIGNAAGEFRITTNTLVKNEGF